MTVKHTYEDLNKLTIDELRILKSKIQDEIHLREMERQEVIRSILYLQECYDLTSFRSRE